MDAQIHHTVHFLERGIIFPYFQIQRDLGDWQLITLARVTWSVSGRVGLNSHGSPAPQVQLSSCFFVCLHEMITVLFIMNVER